MHSGPRKRCAHSYPNLRTLVDAKVAPVFALHGMPPTPTSGERYSSRDGGAGNSVTRHELQALFAVVGERPVETEASLQPLGGLSRLWRCAPKG
jgi:hypothetical protein